MNRDASADELYQRFIVGGFEQLDSDQARELADYLEHRAASTGLSAPLFLALAIRAVYGMFRDHDDCGGVQIDFVRWLDYLVKQSLPEIDNSDPIHAALLAQKFWHEVSARAHGYDPRRDYGM